MTNLIKNTAIATMCLALFTAPVMAEGFQTISASTDGAHEEELHPMNDGWLGMPVETDAGENVGVIIAAPASESGDIVQLIIDTSNADVPDLEDMIVVAPTKAEWGPMKITVPESALDMPTIG